MADDHNLFSKAIGDNTAYGNFKTYVERLPVVVTLMNGTEPRLPSSNSSNSGLGYYLQGVQHFGITVDDMAKR